MTSHTVFLTNKHGEQADLIVEQVDEGLYRVLSLGKAGLEEHVIAFDLFEGADPLVRNLDYVSDSFSCRGLSELVRTPELLWKRVHDGEVFIEAGSLESMQKGLSRLRYALISDNDF